jgi:hypothetical protein
MPRLARTNTDKLDADKLCRLIQDAGAVRGTDGLSGNPAAGGNTEPAESFFNVPAVQEIKRPVEEPDPLAGEGTAVRVYPGGAIRQAKPGPDTAA